MKKRAGHRPARSALDPELLFLDEPTAGLDPIGAAAFDELIPLGLRGDAGFTGFLLTHDPRPLYAICDRVAVLADKRVTAIGTIDELLATDHPWIQEYFRGPRGRAAVASAQAKGTADAEAAAHPTEVRDEQDREAGISAAQMRAH
jgi:phospholipid/cholesterol/gamma-HCH transport system ATP-binding protein